MKGSNPARGKAPNFMNIEVEYEVRLKRIFFLI